jgi:pilus assembly protein CpaE
VSIDNTGQPVASQQTGNGRSVERPKFLGFASDAETTNLLTTAFAPVMPKGGSIRTATFQTTLQTLARMVTPEILLVDISGQDQPLNALMALSEVVDADTKVLLIGEERKLSFYRAVVHTMGIAEYLAKPFTVDAIARHLVPLVEPQTEPTEPRRAGKLVAIAGVRGGVGVTTIAANAAWIIGEELHRHAMLLDTDMHTGNAAFIANAGTSIGLTEALETPGRIDQMLVERVAVKAGHRFHMIAAQNALTPGKEYKPGSSQVLARYLESRFNVVISDCGSLRLPFAQEMLAASQQRVIVLDPSLMAIRNLERLNTLPDESGQLTRPILVLNQSGMPNGLRQNFMEEKIGAAFDVVIPNLRQIIPDAENHGHMAASLKGPFHDAIRKLADLLTTQPNKQLPQLTAPAQPRLTA